MAFDTSGLTGWPSPSELRSSGEDLESDGKKYHEAVGECVNGWASVATHYREGEGREKLMGAMNLPLAHGTAIEVAATNVKGHLDAFADDVEGLETRRTAIQGRISTFNSNASSGDESRKNPEFGYGSQGEIQGKIDAIEQDMVEAADRCAKAINGVDVTDPDFVQAITSKESGLTSGVLAAGLSLSQFEDVRVTRFTTITMVFAEWKRTTVWVPSRVITTPEGRFISMVGLVQEELRVTRITATHTQSWLERQWLNLKPEYNEFFYQNSQKYRDWVNAHADRWLPPSQDKPAWWRADQHLKGTWDDILDAKGWTRFAKGAGPVLTLVTAGLTYKGEYDKAYANLVKEHPDWTEDQIEERARLESGVKGTTKVGLDIAAGMTGAAIGTAIGGPIGTVVGFGVGIGVSWVLDATGAKDAIADGAMWVADGAADLAGEAGDALEDLGGAISDGWDSVFG